MSAHQALYPIATMCRVLEVSTSGYYAWRRREPSARSKSDAALTALIGEIHEWSRGTYGVPRMVKELIARGHHVNPKRVERLMREAGLQGVSRRQRTHTTRRDRDGRVAPDLVERPPHWAVFAGLQTLLDSPQVSDLQSDRRYLPVRTDSFASPLRWHSQ